MGSRRWLWGAAGAAALLWLAQGARAETELEYEQGPYFKRRAASPEAAPAAAARPAARAKATTVRKPAPAHRAEARGYAAEAARTATRLPPEEREARNFLRAATSAVRFDIDASRLAATRAESPLVRTFASGLLEHQGGVHGELLRLLAARGMAPPMVERSQRRALGRLAKLSGPRFDREFLELVGQGPQRRDVRQYEQAVLAVEDAALRAWIDRQLPSLRRHEAQVAALVSRDVRRAAPVAARRVAQGQAGEGAQPDPR